MHNQRRTVNIHTGRKLSGKSRDEILEAVLSRFNDYNVHCVQQFFDLIRVTFDDETAAVSALQEKGVRLFDMWCRMDGGPPTTIVHLFDYPYEDDDEPISAFFGTYGTVKSVRCQKYISHSRVYTGTRLVNIEGYMCRVWFKGQPLVCNLCGGKGHRAADCPNKDKCRLCGSRDHFARNCTNPWNNQGPRAAASSADDTPADQAAGAADDVAPSSDAPSRPPAPESAGPVSTDGSVDSAVSGGSDADVVDSTASDVAGVGGDINSAEVNPSGASVRSMSVETVVSAADGVLNELFASSDDDDDDDDSDDTDGSRADITEFPSVSQPPSQSISQFTDDSQSILCNIPVKPSYSNILTKGNVEENGNENNNETNSSMINVGKSAPNPKTGPSKIPVVSVNRGVPVAKTVSSKVPGSCKENVSVSKMLLILKVLRPKFRGCNGSGSASKSTPDLSAVPPKIPVVCIVDDDNEVESDDLMDTSGGTRKRKVCSGESDSSDDPDPVSLHTEGLSSTKRSAGSHPIAGVPPS